MRDLNEVELTSSTFSSSRGIQTAVKDYVNRAIDDIINADTEWPFTVTAKTFTTTVGKRLYSRSDLSTTDTKTIDYDSVTFLESSIIPTRFETVITERAKYYAFTLRGEVQNAQMSQAQFEKSIKRMRVELINKQLYMRAV